MKNILNIIVFLVITLVVHSCASPGSPTGGLKDETPPVMVESTPAEHALGYDKQDLKIEFDEIVVLKDLTTHFLVSPPTEQKPQVKAYGNDLIIEFEDTLQSNTTYTLYFGDAVVDNNEGNPISDFTFSFSTGYELDTMRLQGYVLDAQTLDPVSETLVGIYSNFSDTAFVSSVPLRIAKTDEKGWFSVQNVKPGKYMVRSLNDMDNNFRFNQPGEMIAFNTEVYETSFEHMTLLDSVFTDSLTEEKEHILVFKELRERDTVVYYPDNILLMAFIEDHPLQLLQEKKREDEKRLDFIFASKVTEDPILRLLDDSINDSWCMPEYSEDSLTVSYWVKDSSMFMLDTITVLFEYVKTDTLEQYFWQRDTLDMRFKRKQKSERQQRKEEKQEEKKEEKKKVEPLSLEQTPSGNVPYFSDITFTSPHPIASIDQSAIKLFEVINDSTFKALKYDFIQDESLARSYHLEYKWNEDKEYQLTIDSASIYDIYGLTNDSIAQRISILGEDKYSTIIINIDNMRDDAMVQLLSASQEVQETQFVSVEEGEAVFFYLKPNKYYVSLFYDTNKNGKWDTGDYSEGIQAEELYFFHKVIEAKAYYEMEEDWDLDEVSILDQKPKELTKKKK